MLLSTYHIHKVLLQQVSSKNMNKNDIANQCILYLVNCLMKQKQTDKYIEGVPTSNSFRPHITYDFNAIQNPVLKHIYNNISSDNILSPKTNQDEIHPPSDACSELFKVIENRKSNPEEGSYTNSLLKEGDNKILKKIGEETAEFIMACKDKDPISIANEAADLIFHLQVALAHQNVSWTEVLKVLVKRREGPRRNQ